MRRESACVAALIVMSLAGNTFAGNAGDFIFTDTPYLDTSSSPFDLFDPGNEFFLEDFEDGLLNTLGLTGIGGEVRLPSAFTDSVDTDDGVLDGFGIDGHNYWSFAASNTGTVARFEFDADILGALPTSAGLVWTDGNFLATTIFEAFGPDGESLGFSVHTLGDATHTGETGEDRFIGLVYAGGISAIEIRADLGRIEVDHIQYGNLVPAPGAFALLGLTGLFARRSRRRKVA